MSKKADEKKKLEEITPEVIDSPMDEEKELGYDPAGNIDDVIDTEKESIEDELEDGDKLTLHLCLAKKHPADRFRLGSLMIDGYAFKKYLLSEAELKELVTAGPMHWLKCEEGALEQLKKELENK